MDAIKEKRFVYLDAIKVLSAFMIIFYHFGHLNFGIIADGSYIPNFNRILLNISSASIPLFFMVNGALVFEKNYSVKVSVLKASKIALLIFVWGFLSFPDWFFKTMIVLYLLYPIFVKILNMKNKIVLYLMCAGLMIFPFLYNYIIDLIILFNPTFSLDILGFNFSLDNLPLHTGLFTMYSILYLFIGYLFHRIKTHPLISLFLLVAGLTLVTFDGVILSNYVGEIHDSVNGCFPTIGAMMLAIGLFTLLKNTEKINSVSFRKVTSFVGSRVLYTYLFHMIIIKIISKYLFNADEYSFIFIIAISLAVYIFCFGIGIIIEKIPILRELVKI